MKNVILLALLIVPQIVAAAPQPQSATAWFTDAVIENSSQISKPANTLPEAPGAIGNGLLLTRPIAIDDPLLAQQNGMISFWIKPEWDGDDGKTHKILRIGDPLQNGLMLEKAASGMLRYVMASPTKITAARSDVSNWKAGEWHHIAIVWMSTDDGVPVGIPLWIDKVCVDGPIGAGNTFLDPSKMSDRRIWIGDATSDAIIDELVMRNYFEVYIAKINTRDKNSQLALVFRDYFRTAPFTKIEIDPDACAVPSDPRVVNGCPKYFGLKAELQGAMIRVTDNIILYGNWSDFDAKPFIKWSTSDEKIATVDTDGVVTGKSVGECKLTAEFHKMNATYDLSVIPVEQPDVDLLYVERLPRYSTKSAKWWPADGENVESVAHIGNYGYKTLPAGAEVRFELIPDANGNFRADPDEKPVETRTQILSKPIAPCEQVVVRFAWKWTNDPVWVRVTVDPDNKIGELCEANNQRCELNIARALKWAYVESFMKENYENKKINIVGSFSYYDWINAHLYRLTQMMQEAVYPTTSPYGIKDAVRTDNFYGLATGDCEGTPFMNEEEYYDGGFPVGTGDSTDLLAIHSGLIHEFGHTCIALPDLYGFPVVKENLFLKDENGRYYSGGPMMPEVSGPGNSWLFDRKTLALSSAQGVPCEATFGPLMDYCYLWLDPVHAGQVQHFAKYRGDKFWGVHGRLMPELRSDLFIYDIDDKPLTGAAVYVYHTTPGPAEASSKYFADRPKFIGHTDAFGRYIFPGQTDESWDDADTDEVDGAIDVWNPFGRVKTDTADTPSSSITDGLLLIKIVSGDQTELHWLPQTEFNKAFFSGEKIRGIYTIRTSLQPSPGSTPIVKSTVPDAIKKKNLKPVAVVEPMEMTVKCGEEFVLDGSKSYDPEGQPIFYRWGVGERWWPGDYEGSPTCKLTAPDEPGDTEYRFYVMDGLRISDMVTVMVHVEK